MFVVLCYSPLIFFIIAFPIFGLPMLGAKRIMAKLPDMKGQIFGSIVGAGLLFCTSLGFQQVQKPLMKLIQWPFSEVELVAKATHGAPYYFHYLVADKWINYRKAETNLPASVAEPYESIATINLLNEKTLESLYDPEPITSR